MYSFGMRGHDLGGKQVFDDFLNKVSENKIENVQLAFKKSISDIDFTLGNFSTGLASHIKRRLDNHNIHIAVLGCYINPTAPDENKRVNAVNTFIEHLKYAKILGADMVGTETGRYDNDFKIVDETYTPMCYERLVESMLPIKEAAEKLGVFVGIEPVATHTLYNPKMLKKFFDEINSPNFVVILDSVNLLNMDNYKNQEAVIDEAFELFGDKISAIHIKDFKIEDNEVKYEQIGDGLFNYHHLFKHLKYKKPYITMLLENSNESRYHSDCEFLKKIYEQV